MPGEVSDARGGELLRKGLQEAGRLPGASPGASDLPARLGVGGEVRKSPQPAPPSLGLSYCT